MKPGFWSSDWLIGLAVTIAIMLFSGSAFMQGLDRAVYDFGVTSSSREPNGKVAVIAIDDESIANLGRFPWPRDIHAQLHDLLREGKAKAVGQTVMFTEPQVDPGLAYINKIKDNLKRSSLIKKVPSDLKQMEKLVGELAKWKPAKKKLRPGEKAVQQLRKFYPQSSLAKQLGGDISRLEKMLAQAQTALNADLQLARSIRSAGNVVLAELFMLGEPQGNPDQELPKYIQRNTLNNVQDRIGALEQGLFPYPTTAALIPTAMIGRQAAAIGHLNTLQDVDGGIRTEPLVLLHYDTYIPSMALQLVARSLNLKMDEVKVFLGEGVQLGRLNIATNPFLEMNTFFYSDQAGKSPFPVDSFFDVISGKIPAEKYRDKIVLIGATAVGLGDAQVTPAGSIPPILTLAHSVSSILNEEFFVTPPWADGAKWGLLLLIAIYLIVLLPKLKAGMAAAVTVVVLGLLLGGEVGLLISQAQWVPLALPATLLFLGHLVLTTKRFLVTEKGKEKSETESAESNRMLGLQFQGQGQLDMAFEKFRRCPMDESIMDVLYNLALDFERKRQFNKASSVYQYMSSYDAKFRDIADRQARTKAMEETVMFGGVGPSSSAGTMIMDTSDGLQKPMLGRYEVEKELGKGAMGVVYLGKDPKINRVVAIKTMALSQEFDEDELEEVKERFFREAETAGRLTHPNIVTIFDAGEEHDLAYIAMEFLKGKDLAPYTKEDSLLPLATTVELVAQAADALSYAHSQNVVHRDIKPANLMWDRESGAMKITDFGIARITDSSKTKTGMVLGTPSYMSPEQLSGKKVDGRSDLFSLGVMLYQMVSGQLPFKGDSMATLMFKIANDPHQDIQDLLPTLPNRLKSVIDKALQKEVEKRYQNGAEMSRDLRASAAEIGTTQ